jgi:hypothetical protein
VAQARQALASRATQKHKVGSTDGPIISGRLNSALLKACACFFETQHQIVGVQLEKRTDRVSMPVDRKFSRPVTYEPG